MTIAKPLQRLLKPIALASVLIALTACGGGGGGDGDDAGVPPINVPSSLAGLWEVQTGTQNGNSVQIPSGEVYFYFTDVDASGVTGISYSKNSFSNCLDAEGPARFITIGGNQYRDESGDVVSFTVTGNSLDVVFDDEEGLVIFIAGRIIGIDVADLPVCTSNSVRTAVSTGSFWTNLALLKRWQ